MSSSSIRRFVVPAAAVLHRGERMADIRRDFGMHIVDDAVTIAWAMAVELPRQKG
jgi:hypothetical protein